MEMSGLDQCLHGRMNAFQRVMYQWSDLHPYNAVHAYRISRPLHAERLRESICRAYRQVGCGFVETDAAGRWYRHEVDLDPPLEIVDGGHNVEAVLRDVFARELNTPFARPRCRPMRFTAVAVGPADHYVCMGYNHWTADSVAARLLGRRILNLYLNLGLPEEPPLELYPDTYREVFAAKLGRLRVVRALGQAVSQMLWQRRICRPPYTAVTHFPVGFAMTSTADGAVDRLRHFARSLGATVHDVMLAALARAIVENLPRRATDGGFRPLAMGTIVDTRGDSEVDLSTTFGTFLSYYGVRFLAEPGTGLAEVTRRVAALTRPIKAQRAYLDALPQMRLFSAAWPLLSQRRKAYYARLALPLTAGISNVVIREPWLNAPGTPIVDYLRGSPTGPMLPLTAAVTTLGNRINIGLTYRQAGFTASRLGAILGMFQEQLERPDHADRSRFGSCVHACPAAAACSPAAA
jgi:NRPS condensation-like uncharacterized protein